MTHWTTPKALLFNKQCIKNKTVTISFSVSIQCHDSIVSKTHNVTLNRRPLCLEPLHMRMYEAQRRRSEHSVDPQILWSLWNGLERVYEHVPRESDVEVPKPQKLSAMTQHGSFGLLVAL